MKNLKSYMLIGVLFVSALGTLFHFVYDWSGGNLLVSLFAPINESIWEHTKLLFFPMLLYALYAKNKLNARYPCLFSSMIAGMLLGVAAIVVLFYTYSGILGFHVAFVDISIFYISVILAFFFAYRLTLSCKTDAYSVFLKLLLIALVVCYLLFTFFPPNIPLFINPK